MLLACFIHVTFCPENHFSSVPIDPVHSFCGYKVSHLLTVMETPEILIRLLPIYWILSSLFQFMCLLIYSILEKNK